MTLEAKDIPGAMLLSPLSNVVCNLAETLVSVVSLC